MSRFGNTHVAHHLEFSISLYPFPSQNLPVLLNFSSLGYGGPDWTKINNLVFTDLVLHYGQKDLDFENDEPIKKRPPFKEISAPIMGDRDEQAVRAQIGTDKNTPYC